MPNPTSQRLKPPAFQFYPDNFISGTAHFTAEESGAYIRLLCFQWNAGAIPSEKEAIDRIAGCQVSQTVMMKFVRGKNARMEIERNKQAAFRAKQAVNGALGGRPQTKGLGYSGLAKSEAKESSPSSSPSSVSDFTLRSPPPSSEGTKKATLEEVRLLCAKSGIAEVDADWFWHKCEGNGWTNAGKPIKRWGATLIAWKTAGYLPSQKHEHDHRNHKPTVSEIRNSHILGADASGSKAVAILAARRERDEREAQARKAQSAGNGVATQVAGPGGDAS